MTSPNTSLVADILTSLHDEEMRLSGQSIDRGCVDSGLAANIARAASTAIEAQQAEIERRARAVRDAALNTLRAIGCDEELFAAVAAATHASLNEAPTKEQSS